MTPKAFLNAVCVLVVLIIIIAAQQWYISSLKKSLKSGK